MLSIICFASELAFHHYRASSSFFIAILQGAGFPSSILERCVLRGGLSFSFFHFFMSEKTKAEEKEKHC
jgi:hypothetical protein